MEKTNENLIKALSKVQSELKAPKGQYNSFANFRYRSCEDILESVKPILAKYNLVLNLSDELVMIGDRYYIKAIAGVTDGEDIITSVAYAREPQELPKMSDSQVTGTASSYARKYALNGLFAIDDTKDPDTDDFKKQTSQEETSTEQSKEKILKATPSQIENLKKYYQDEKMTKLLQVNNITKIEDLPMEKASELLSKIFNKGAK